MDDLELSLRKLGSRGRGAVAAGVVRGEERAFGCWFPQARPVDPRSLFEIGSITKAFTGVLLADMVLAGEVALDDPLSRHLRYPRPAWRGREPTLLELATHRSGLPNSPGAMQRRELAFAAGVRRADPWTGVTREDYDRLASAESPRREPGGRMRYSSLGLGLLGDALAARAGTSYEALLAERVLRPLGMARTGVQPAGAVVPGHSRRGRPRPPLHDHMPGAGSLRSSADDMLRFLAACVRPPAERPGPALALAQQPHARLARGAQIGLGWMLVAARRGRPRIVWHNGATWGFRSFAGFAPGSGSAVVLLSSAPRPVERAGFRLLG